jgi:hypothetical protein
MGTSQPNASRPRLFIGSSGEAKGLAEALQFNLDADVEALVWNQGLIRLGETVVESLDRVSREVDFAALIVTADDITETRGTRRPAARDNVLFEAGLFMGRQHHDVGLPSDLAGLTIAEYSNDANGHPRAALNRACILIKEAIARSGGLPAKTDSPPAESLNDSTAHVPRPRRCSSLGVAIPSGPKRELRIVNISVSGALLQTPGRLPIGQSLDLDLQLDNGTIVSVTASVVRIQEPDWERIGGVGVTFTSVAETARAVLEAYVAADRPAA